MKKLSWVTGILICMTVLLAEIGAVCGAVDQMAEDEAFYGSMSREAVAEYLGAEKDPQASEKITAYIGLSAEQQSEFAAQMAAFMAGETDDQPEVLNRDEQLHMLDVRVLTQKAAQMSKSCFTLAAALAVAAAWTGSKLKRRWLPVVLGLLGAAALMGAAAGAVYGVMHSGGFADLFVKMHEMLFTNDLWLMNPAEDILIRMMPQPLFEQALANCTNLALRLLAVVGLMLAAVYFIVEGMVRRQAAKGENI